jgi:CHAT domain-containing protein/predicted negative regulator of RcsB-dependent stress response
MWPPRAALHLALAATLAAAAWSVAPRAHAQAQEGLAPMSAVTQAALARQRDAESLFTLSAEGRALYERDVIKLDGYGYCGRAVSLAEQGEFRQSIRAASKALHLANENDSDDLKALAQRDLAIAYSYAGLLDEAERYASGALKFKANDPQQAYAPSHKILGDVAARRGKFDEAVAAYARALQLASERFKPLIRVSLANAYTSAGRPRDALAQLDTLTLADQAKLGAYITRSRANALLAAGQPNEAGALFRRVADDTNAADAAYQRLWAFEGLGRVEIARGNRVAALAAYLETVKLADSLRGKFQSDEFKTGLFGNVQGVFDTALALSLETRDFEAAWTLSEAARSRQLLDTLRERASDTLAAQRVSLADLRKQLGATDGVLQFHVLPERSIVWLITRAGMSATVLPVGQEALSNQVEAFRKSVIERRRDTVSQAQALHKTLLADMDTSSAQNLFIVPHGPLHYLPFQALHDGRGFLIERSAVTVWPSAAVGSRLLARGNAPAASLLGFGNPATDRNVPLPGAEREVQQVARLFGGKSQIYLQHEATRDRFKADANRASVLHVAAHAEVDEVDPLFSRILFASSKTDTGLLEARDVYALDMSSVRLVTLSACESGLGKVARGDEIIGFTRSFLSAGANSIVASLWPVADDSTDLLMNKMYRELAAGRDLMQSMQQAQLEVQKNRRFAHPFFWAPFNVIGNGRLLVSAAEVAR